MIAMIFGKTRWQKKMAARKRVFALWPIQLDDERWVWLGWVARYTHYEKDDTKNGTKFYTYYRYPEVLHGSMIEDDG